MNEEVFNLSIRKFLKSFGLNGQHEIEQAVASALARGAVSGKETLPGRITLEIPGLSLKSEFKGEISLE
ncbi:MAG: hypothetical protein HIU85_17160 [Proteobacteria bacterium]|nr:hypothetical protein [Pseudomonadota bacterium]